MKKTPGTWNKLPLLALAALLAVPAHAQISKVVNAASFVQNTSLTPSSIATVFGAHLSNTTAFASNPLALPTTLGNATVTVAGIPSKLFYVSPTQINFQIDPLVPLGTATLTVTSPAGTFNFTLQIAQAGAPGLFSTHASGTRDGAILNAVTFETSPFSVTTNGGPTFLALYATGLDFTFLPVVTIGGVQVPVQYAGLAPGFLGLQQINVQLVPALAGAGRVEVAVTCGAKTTNIVEVVILPSPGQVTFAPKKDNEARHRELAAIAWVPGTHLALLTDENDDVVRMIDVVQAKVVKTITLADGAEPVAVAVNETGTTAVVAERNRGRVALITLATLAIAEVEVASGPSSVAIAGTRAVVVSQDQDVVSIIDLAANPPAVQQLAVGRAPRYVSLDGNRAFVTNQGDGSISVIDLSLTPAKVVNTYLLGADARPFAIQVVHPLNVAVVTEPSQGKLLLVDLASGNVTATTALRTEKSGGLSDIALWGGNVYLANQTGASVTLLTLLPGPPVVPAGTTATIKVDIGARALAVDVLDRRLLVTNQGSGTVVLVNLDTNAVVGRVNGVRCECESEDDDHDQRDDRDKSANVPTITAISPTSAKAGASLVLNITGTNLAGATEVAFFDPSKFPGKGQGPFHDDHGRGPAMLRDSAFTAKIKTATATSVTVDVAIAAAAVKGIRVVRVFTPGGETTLSISAANQFRVE